MKRISEKTIQRLIIYRKILRNIKSDEAENIYSHSLAAFAGSSAAQVRRDLMVVGYTGSPIKGYNIKELNKSVGKFLDHPKGQAVALVGLGNLGRAILDYCRGRRIKLQISVAFDKDRKKINQHIEGCKCYHISELERVIKERNIDTAILSVPAIEAQKIADDMINAGIKGILNYSPIRLKVPQNVYVENRDMLLALEKTAYFARTMK